MILYPRYLFRKTTSLGYLKDHFQGLKSFLEVGGGAGDFSFSLLSQIKDGTVIDFSEEAVDALRERNKKDNLQIVMGDFLTFPFDRKFSLVVMFEVLEHIRHDVDAIRKVYDLLEQRGLFLLSVPARKSRWTECDGMAGHYRRYEKDGLVGLLEENGFEIMKIGCYGFPVLNVIAYFRVKLLRKNDAEDNIKEEMSKKSGLGYIDSYSFKSLLSFIITTFFDESTMRFWVSLTSLFDKYDLGDGYLCLARKTPRSRDEMVL